MGGAGSEAAESTQPRSGLGIRVTVIKFLLIKTRKGGDPSIPPRASWGSGDMAADPQWGALGIRNHGCSLALKAVGERQGAARIKKPYWLVIYTTAGSQPCLMMTTSTAIYSTWCVQVGPTMTTSTAIYSTWCVQVGPTMTTSPAIYSTSCVQVGPTMTTPTAIYSISCIQVGHTTTISTAVYSILCVQVGHTTTISTAIYRTNNRKTRSNHHPQIFKP